MSTTGGVVTEYIDEVLQPSISVLPYDTRAAGWPAAERARLTEAGKTPPFADGQIAAIARTNDLMLATSNVSDFAGFESLRIEDRRAT